MAISELLSDFREVEHNYLALDQGERERTALWEESKGELLEEIMGLLKANILVCRIRAPHWLECLLQKGL